MGRWLGPSVRMPAPDRVPRAARRRQAPTPAARSPVARAGARGGGACGPPAPDLRFPLGRRLAAGLGPGPRIEEALESFRHGDDHVAKERLLLEQALLLRIRDET